MHRQVAHLLALALVLGIALETRPARAQEGHRLEWRDEWRRVGIPEYAAITGFIGGHLAVRYLIAPAEDAVWTRPVLFDSSAREALVIQTSSGRTTAGRVSDFVALASILQPVLIDAVIVAGIADDNSDVAVQLGVISVQSYSATLFLNTLAKRFFARERPFGSACAKDPEYTENCEDFDRFRSYYSGHAAITATSAGLTCAHHTHLPLYGSGVADVSACIGAVVGTLTTGTLRIAADRHWATDVMTGTVLGFTVGYVLPTLIYYQSFKSHPEESSQASTQAPLRPQFVYSGMF